MRVHFVGLNPKRVPWVLDGRGAHEAIRELWDRYASELAHLVPSSCFPAALADS